MHGRPGPRHRARARHRAGRPRRPALAAGRSHSEPVTRRERLSAITSTNPRSSRPSARFATSGRHARPSPSCGRAGITAQPPHPPQPPQPPPPNQPPPPSGCRVGDREGDRVRRGHRPQGDDAEHGQAGEVAFVGWSARFDAERPSDLVAPLLGGRRLQLPPRSDAGGRDAARRGEPHGAHEGHAEEADRAVGSQSSWRAGRRQRAARAGPRRPAPSAAGDRRPRRGDSRARRVAAWRERSASSRDGSSTSVSSVHSPWRCAISASRRSKSLASAGAVTPLATSVVACPAS